MNRLAPLTSLRFFAALLVLCQHYFDFRFGHAGVSFFYVLSGFILTYNYHGKLISGSAVRSFFWKRFARIYPTHLLTLCMAIPLTLANMGTKWAVKFAANVTLLHSWAPSEGAYFSFNAPSWSISDEAFFYALFPLLLAWLSKGRGRWLGIWVGASLAIAAVWMIWWPDPSTKEPVTHWLFYINPAFRLVEFAIGVWLGVEFRSGQRALGKPQEAGAVLLATATLASAYVLPARAGPFLASLWFVPAATGLVYVFARSQGAFARVLANRFLLLLGEASFMLYMTHWLVLRYAAGIAPLWTLAALAIGVSVIGHLWFEMPVKNLLARRRLRSAAVV